MFHAPVALSEGEIPDDPGTRLAARDLARQGAELLAEGRFDEALPKLKRARELVPAPTIRVLEAVALARLGRLVEAAEAYEAVRRTKLTLKSPTAFRDAVKTADDDLAKLRPRIPRLVVQVRGASPESVTVEVDGYELPRAMLDMPRPIDPGAHDVVVWGPNGYHESRQVTLKEGEEQQTLFQVPAAAPPDRVEPESDVQRTIGWVTLGVGAAGLAVGAGAGLLMLEKKSELDEVCASDGSCPAPFESDYDTFRAARTASWIGYGVGFAGLGVGAILLLTAPDSSEAQDEACVRPWLGPTHVGVLGRF
jgi:hypothetical protein